MIPFALVAATLAAPSAPVRAQAPDSVPRQAIAGFLEQAGRAGFSGAVLVARGGEILVEGAWGVADSGSGAPMSTATAFDIGSLAKPFTAAAILRLEAARLLTVADSLGRFLPDVPPDKRGITIHHLLTHTAGLATDHGLGDATAASRDEVVRAILATPLRHAPGARYAYSNAGYVLLAAIVELASGRSFPEFLQGEFLDRLALTSTGFFGDPRWRDRPVAAGYLNGLPRGSPATWASGWGQRGDGGIASTTGDLFRWFRALVEARVVSPGQLEQMFAPLAAEEEGAWSGYGWSIAETPLGRRIGQHGTGAGGNADLAWYADRDLLVIVLSNQATVRSWLGAIPLEVRLPATELSRQLAANLARGDFSEMPRTTFRARTILVTAGMLLAAIGLLAGAIWARLSRRRPPG